MRIVEQGDKAMTQNKTFDISSFDEIKRVEKNVSPRSYTRDGISEEFRFTNERTYGYGIKNAYKAYNSRNEEVGFVFMTNDMRTPSYGYAELRFHTPYKGKTWHRFKTNGKKMSWSLLCQYLNNFGEYKLYID